MKRITKKEGVITQTDNDGNITKTIYIEITKPDEVNRKLYEYENIEELCEKMISQPIYEKYEYTGEIHEEDFKGYTALYNFKERRIELYEEGFPYYFELDSYGEKWSLSREELENGKID